MCVVPVVKASMKLKRPDQLLLHFHGVTPCQALQTMLAHTLSQLLRLALVFSGLDNKFFFKTNQGVAVRVPHVLCKNRRVMAFFRRREKARNDRQAIGITLVTVGVIGLSGVKIPTELVKNISAEEYQWDNFEVHPSW